jgi:hypothetical protein
LVDYGAVSAFSASPFPSALFQIVLAVFPTALTMIFFGVEKPRHQKVKSRKGIDKRKRAGSISSSR